MLILLVGPKGSGKSHIGRLLESRLGAHFFHVEPLWMAYHAACRTEGREPEIEEGIRYVHPEVERSLAAHDLVSVETTGASPEILGDLLRIGERHGLLTARIRARLETCLARIESRDATHQIPMGADMIRKVYELGENVDLRFDITIDNEDAVEGYILDRFRAALSARGVSSR